MEFQDFIDLIWSRKKQIVILTFVIVGVVSLATFLISPIYEATAIVKVSPSPFSMGTRLSREEQIQQAKELAVLAGTRSITEKVINSLGLELSPSQLASRVETSVDTEAPLITISVTDSNPTRAQQIANTVGMLLTEVSSAGRDFSEEYEEYEKSLEKKLENISDEIKNLSEQQEGLKRQLAAMPSPPSADQNKKQVEISILESDMAVLKNEHARLILIKRQKEYYEEFHVTIVSPAMKPVTPIEPKPWRNALLALFGGLLLNISLVTLNESVKKRRERQAVRLKRKASKKSDQKASSL